MINASPHTCLYQATAATLPRTNRCAAARTDQWADQGQLGHDGRGGVRP
jgi:hypothetical protein